MGSMLSLFAVGCPICNKLVVMAVGVSGALNWFAPLQPLLAGGSLVLQLASFQWSPALHDFVEPAQILAFDACRQAQLLQRTFRTAATQADKIQRDGLAHAPFQAQASACNRLIIRQTSYAPLAMA